MPSGIFFSDEFIPAMEQELHVEPSAEFVVDQFVSELDDFNMSPGDTRRVQGMNFLAAPTDPYADRKLASIADKVSDNAAQHVDMFKQEFQLEEYLLPNALQVQEYEGKHSFHDQAAMNGAVLARDYFGWRDKYFIKRMTDSTYVKYVANAANAAALTTSNKISIDEILMAKTKLQQRFIPAYSDGTYVCIIDDATVTTLLTETKFLDASSRALGANAPLFRGELTVVGGVRFVRSNNIPIVLAGGSNFDGAQALLFGSSTLGLLPLGSADGAISADRANFMRSTGAGPLVALRGMPVEVRLREVTDYGRFQEMIWIEHSMTKVLDPGVNAYDGAKTIGTDSRFIQKLVGATVMS